MLQLATSVALSASIQTVRLPSFSQQGYSFNGYQGRIAGFGYTSSEGPISNQLLWINSRIILNYECAAIFGSSVVVESTICAYGWDSTSHSACLGDSGGAIVIQEIDGYTQIGTISFLSEYGCEAGYPFGASRTSYYLDWISSVTGIEIRE